MGRDANSYDLTTPLQTQYSRGVDETQHANSVALGQSGRQRHKEEGAGRKMGT
jgi:hypothetical protein